MDSWAVHRERLGPRHFLAFDVCLSVSRLALCDDVTSDAALLESVLLPLAARVAALAHPKGAERGGDPGLQRNRHHQRARHSLRNQRAQLDNLSVWRSETVQLCPSVQKPGHLPTISSHIIDTVSLTLSRKAFSLCASLVGAALWYTIIFSAGRIGGCIFVVYLIFGLIEGPARLCLQGIALKYARRKGIAAGIGAAACFFFIR